MERTPVHVIDFEGSRQSGILEYGVVTLRGTRIEATETRLCGATGTISDRERKEHGISEDSVAGIPPFHRDWTYFAGLRRTGPFCAHNANVEDGFLRAVWPFPRSSPDFSTEDGVMNATWGPWLDTLYLYRRLHPRLPSHKLEPLIAAFGLGEELKEWGALYCPAERSSYHCALYDALASALLLRRLLAEPEYENPGLRWLFVQSSASDAARESREQQRLF